MRLGWMHFSVSPPSRETRTQMMCNFTVGDGLFLCMQDLVKRNQIVYCQTGHLFEGIGKPLACRFPSLMLLRMPHTWSLSPGPGQRWAGPTPGQRRANAGPTLRWATLSNWKQSPRMVSPRLEYKGPLPIVPVLCLYLLWFNSLPWVHFQFWRLHFLPLRFHSDTTFHWAD